MNLGVDMRCLGLAIVLALAALAIGCDNSGFTQSNFGIPMPGTFNGEPLWLVGTSRERCSLLHASDGKIEYVWWNDSFIVLKTHPLKYRNLFEGDTYEEPDYDVWEWGIVDLKSQKLSWFWSQRDYEKTLEKLQLDKTKVELLDLRAAWRLRQKELGFTFTRAELSKYRRAQSEMRFLTRYAGIYRDRVGRMPESLSTLRSIHLEDARASTVVLRQWPEDKAPLDPWDNEYRYVYPNTTGGHDLWSKGPPGGKPIKDY